jgi:Haem-NO-binding
MKGIVFTEFLDFVELQHGYETVDAMLEMAAPPSGGVYTAVGSYDFSEMAALLGALSHVSGAPAPELLQAFGRHLFARFAEIYPVFFRNTKGPLDFLETIEGRIHTEVVKLYPDAELPRLSTERLAEDKLVVVYRSCRPLGHLCLGLIEGCGKYFDADLRIQTSANTEGLDITVQTLPAHPKAEARP